MLVTHRFYVYMLLRPWNGVPCYVGKGQSLRVFYHAAMGAQHYNKHLASIFKKAGGHLPFVILFSSDDEDESLAWETRFIVAIGRADLKQGPLCNKTNGGEGVSGYVFSEEQNSRNAEINQARWASMSDEWKSDFAETRSVGVKAYLDGLTSDQKLQRVSKAVETTRSKLAKMTPEQKAERMAPAIAASLASRARKREEKSMESEIKDGSQSDQRPGASRD